MSLYNMLFGANPISDVLLAVLGLTRKDVGRFRDCFIDGDGERIAVYTRNGGGNREHYNWDNEDEDIPRDPEECHCTGCTITYHLPKHPLYLYDRDDDFDCTYCTVYFKVPEWAQDGVKRLATGEKFDPDKRWKAMLDNLGKLGKAQGKGED